MSVARYEIREPPDMEFGQVASDGAGNWTGMVGVLQRQEADFSMDLTLTMARASVVHFSMVYIDESLVIISPKPRPLPEYLSLIRPFEGIF